MDVFCQCGTIAFKTPLPKPLAIYICHCHECQRQSSSAFGCSAIFPKFPLPCKDMLSCYSWVPLSRNFLALTWLKFHIFNLGQAEGLADGSRRPTASGNQLDCYFCRNCGTRLVHITPEKDVVSIKGGCIEGLDWQVAKHIWCKRAGKSSHQARPGCLRYSKAGRFKVGWIWRGSVVPIPKEADRFEEEPSDWSCVAMWWFWE